MKSLLRWLGIFLGVLLTGVLGGIFYLAWRASRRTGKSVIGSVSDVPEEAQLLVSEAESRASEAVSASLRAARDRAAALKSRIPIIGSAEEVSTEQPQEAENKEGVETQPEAETSESEPV